MANTGRTGNRPESAGAGTSGTAHQGGQTPHGGQGQHHQGQQGQPGGQGGGSSPLQKGQEMASGVAQKASDLASGVAQRAGDALSGVGERVGSWAGSLRENLPHEGPMGTVATAAVTQLQAGARYLQHHDLGDMADDLSGMVRRYPMQSVLVGFGLGFVLGKMMSGR